VLPCVGALVVWASSCKVSCVVSVCHRRCLQIPVFGVFFLGHSGDLGPRDPDWVFFMTHVNFACGPSRGGHPVRHVTGSKAWALLSVTLLPLPQHWRLADLAGLNLQPGAVQEVCLCRGSVPQWLSSCCCLGPACVQQHIPVWDVCCVWYGTAWQLASALT
jgi:hypothetical protein